MALLGSGGITRILNMALLRSGGIARILNMALLGSGGIARILNVALLRDGHLHSPRKLFPVATKHQLEWAPEPIWTLWRT
jgi:hypothetical protein